MLPRAGRIITFERGTRGMLAAAGAIRRRSYDRGVLLPPSFSSALMLRLGGVHRLRGAATDGRAWLLSEPLSPARLRDVHRTRLYMELVTGARPDGLPVPRLPVPQPDRDVWIRSLAAHAGGRSDHSVMVGIFPGSNAPARRWDTARYAALARTLSAEGARVVVFGTAAERAITAEVAAGGGVDMGGRTELRTLAAALAECHILVTNDSGPMHLAAAVGTRTLVVSGPADTRETAPVGNGHVYLQRLDLPCVPCVRNECPRSGAGYILPEAERECLRLIEVQDVVSAARRMLRA
jgi:heptosyltransferase II